MEFRGIVFIDSGGVTQGDSGSYPRKLLTEELSCKTWKTFLRERHLFPEEKN